jgi:hypothetical protein
VSHKVVAQVARIPHRPVCRIKCACPGFFLSRFLPPSSPARQRGVDPAFDHYPKYTGGFHARYFDEIPSLYGTRVMRGSAW